MQPAPIHQNVVSSGMSKFTFYLELLRSRPKTEHNTSQIEFPPQQMQQQEPIDADELSRTAGLLVDAVKEEANPKFQNSAFLGLMRQFRDKEMVVDGTNVVRARSSTDGTPSSTWSQDFTTLPDVKGKGKARLENRWADTSQNSARKSVHFGRPEFLVEHLDTERFEDQDDRYWMQENKEYQNYWNSPHHAESLRVPPDWDRLQNDWDRFEATATGIKPVSVYQFQPNNPYLTGDSSTRNHIMHTQRIHSNEVSWFTVSSTFLIKPKIERSRERGICAK